MSGIELPGNLLAAMREPGDKLGDRLRWLAELPELLADVTSRWSLRVGSPYQPGGVTSWTAPVVTSAGDDAVLKAAWRHDEALHEPDALRLWDGEGAVRLLRHEDWRHSSVLLLERCEPGTPLSAAMAGEAQDVVVATLLRRLWVRPPDAGCFRPLEAMCDAWAHSFERRYAAAPVPSRLDPGIVRDGIGVWRALPRDATSDVLLVTDLHAGNVLAAQREPWLGIDPKPYVGDPAYDPLQHMLNHVDRLGAAPLGFAARMADLTGVDGDRLLRWLFARCVVESLDEPEWGALAPRLAPYVV